MTILVNDMCGERRLAFMDGDRPEKIIICRDLALNFGDIVEARITAFQPLLKGYFAETDRGAVFIPTTQALTDGQVVRAQIVKEARPGKDATAHLISDAVLPPEIKPDKDISALEMDEIIAEAMAGTVPFGKGACLRIERTQVAWTIDVDSGQSREPLSLINQLAVREIARQTALKNMGGLILVDFAGSKRGKAGKILESELQQALKEDALVSACRPTPAGLFEIERRRERADLWTLCAPNNPVAVFYRVRRAIEASRSGNPVVRVAPAVLALLRQAGIRARVEPLFDRPVADFEIEV